jgi:uncharacterized membrane protein
MSAMMKTGHNSFAKKSLFYAFLIIYSAVLLYLCKVLNIWLDEAYTLDTTARPLSQVITQSYSFESQPPVYFILLSLWRKISADVFFARLFSLISIGLAACFFYKLIRLLSAVEGSKWLVLLFLLNPFIVWAGLEIRLYAFLLLLSTILIYLFLAYYIEGKNKYLYLFLITSLIGLYTQYFFAFLIAALVFAVLIFKGWKTAFKISLYLLPIILLFLPNLVFMGDQLGMVQSQKAEFSTVQRVGIVLHSPQNVTFAMDSLPFKRVVRLSILFLFIAFIGYAYLRAYKKNKENKTTYFELLNFSIVAGIVLVFILAIFIAFTGIDHQDRYLTIALPFFILLFSLFGIHSFFQSRVMYTVLTIYFAAILLYNYSSPVKQYDYKAVAKFVDVHERPNEPLLFYHSVLSIPFSYYYTGKNPIVPLPHEVHFDTTYMNNIKDTVELSQSLKNMHSTSKSYLLISDLNEEKYKDNENRKMVNDYFNLHYAVTFDTLYFGLSKNRSLRIRRLEEK